MTMKVTQKEKDSEKIIWDQMRSASGSPFLLNRALPKLMLWFVLFVFASYMVYTLKLVSSKSCNNDVVLAHNSLFIHSSEINSSKSIRSVIVHEEPEEKPEEKTGLEHIVFGIAASAKLWVKRKEYIKLWWKPEEEMRGIVWLDKPVKTSKGDGESLPELRISGDTSRFDYRNRQGHRSAIRISRIVSETLRLGMENVRWFVMGDDDTVFVTDNLVRILNKYDHNQYYYIGSLSESHLQNIYFFFAKMSYH